MTKKASIAIGLFLVGAAIAVAFVMDNLYVLFIAIPVGAAAFFGAQAGQKERQRRLNPDHDK